MIGSGNLTFGPSFDIQEDYAAKPPQSAAVIRTNAANVALIQQSMDTNKQSLQQQPRQPQETGRDSDSESQLDTDSNQVIMKKKKSKN